MLFNLISFTVIISTFAPQTNVFNTFRAFKTSCSDLDAKSVYYSGKVEEISWNCIRSGNPKENHPSCDIILDKEQGPISYCYIWKRYHY